MPSIREQIFNRLGPDKAKLWIWQLARQINRPQPIDEASLPEIEWDEHVTEWLYLDQSKTVMWNDGPHTLYYGQRIQSQLMAEALRDNGFKIRPSASTAVQSNDAPKRRGRTKQTSEV